MQTECPHCHTLFRVNEEQLQAADGQVRCGKCNTVFTAEVMPTAETVLIEPDESELLVDEIAIDELEEVEIEVGELTIPDTISSPEIEASELESDALELPIDESEQPNLRLINSDNVIPGEDEIEIEVDFYPDLTESQIGALSLNRPHEAANQPNLATTTTDESDDPIPVLLNEDSSYAPDQLYPELENAPLSSPAGNTGYIIAAIVLILLFIGQSTYLLRDHLAERGLRPVMERFCQHLNCELALARAPDSIILKRREIRSHPNIKNALSVTATIVNQADFRQAYPILQIQFQNIEGQLVAGRDFLPGEYLPDDVQIKSGIAPHTPVNIALELVDPGEKAINFLFIFK